MIYVVQHDGSVVSFEKDSWLHKTLLALPEKTRPKFHTKKPKEQ
jgi:hypothetical protein